MANLPGGLPGDVFFGDPSKPLPNWRKAKDVDRDDDEPTEQDYKAVAGMLGFDPRELNEPNKDGKRVTYGEMFRERLRRIEYAKSAKIAKHPITGKHVSANNKSGDPRCSGWASQLALGTQTSESQRGMALCRQLAKMAGQARMHRAAGNDAQASQLEAQIKSGGKPATPQSEETEQPPAQQPSATPAQAAEPAPPKQSFADKAREFLATGKAPARDKPVGRREEAPQAEPSPGFAAKAKEFLARGKNGEAAKETGEAPAGEAAASAPTEPEPAAPQAAAPAPAPVPHPAQTIAPVPPRGERKPPSERQHTPAERNLAEAFEAHDKARMAAERSVDTSGGRVDPEQEQTLWNIAKQKAANLQAARAAVAKEQAKASKAAPATARPSGTTQPLPPGEGGARPTAKDFLASKETPTEPAAGGASAGQGTSPTAAPPAPAGGVPAGVPGGVVDTPYAPTRSEELQMKIAAQAKQLAAAKAAKQQQTGQAAPPAVASQVTGQPTAAAPKSPTPAPSPLEAAQQAYAAAHAKVMQGGGRAAEEEMEAAGREVGHQENLAEAKKHFGEPAEHPGTKVLDAVAAKEEGHAQGEHAPESAEHPGTQALDKFQSAPVSSTGEPQSPIKASAGQTPTPQERIHAVAEQARAAQAAPAPSAAPETAPVATPAPTPPAVPQAAAPSPPKSIDQQIKDAKLAAYRERRPFGLRDEERMRNALQAQEDATNPPQPQPANVPAAQRPSIAEREAERQQREKDDRRREASGVQQDAEEIKGKQGVQAKATPAAAQPAPTLASLTQAAIQAAPPPGPEPTPPSSAPAPPEQSREERHAASAARVQATLASKRAAEAGKPKAAEAAAPAPAKPLLEAPPAAPWDLPSGRDQPSAARQRSMARLAAAGKGAQVPAVAGGAPEEKPAEAGETHPPTSKGPTPGVYGPSQNVIGNPPGGKAATQIPAGAKPEQGAEQKGAAPGTETSAAEEPELTSPKPESPRGKIAAARERLMANRPRELSDQEQSAVDVARRASDGDPQAIAHMKNKAERDIDYIKHSSKYTPEERAKHLARAEKDKEIWTREHESVESQYQVNKKEIKQKILNHLADDNEHKKFTAQDVADALGMHRSEARRALDELHHEGDLNRKGETTGEGKEYYSMSGLAPPSPGRAGAMAKQLKAQEEPTAAAAPTLPAPAAPQAEAPAVAEAGKPSLKEQAAKHRESEFNPGERSQTAKDISGIKAAARKEPYTGEHIKGTTLSAHSGKPARLPDKGKSKPTDYHDRLSREGRMKEVLDRVRDRVENRSEARHEAETQQVESARNAADERRSGAVLPYKERTAREAKAGAVHVKRSEGGDYEGRRVSDVPASSALTRANEIIARRKAEAAATPTAVQAPSTSAPPTPSEPTPASGYDEPAIQSQIAQHRQEANQHTDEAAKHAKTLISHQAFVAKGKQPNEAQRRQAERARTERERHLSAAVVSHRRANELAEMMKAGRQEAAETGRKPAEGPEGGKASAPAAPTASHESQIKQAFETADKANKGTDFVKINDVRRALPHIPREEFDKALNAMRRERHFSLDTHEGLHGTLTPEERAAGIKERGPSADNPANLVYMSRAEKYQRPAEPGKAAQPAPPVGKSPTPTSGEAPAKPFVMPGLPATKEYPDLPKFSADVKAAAKSVGPEGRFGDKAWIHDVHQAYEKAHGHIPLDAFKRKLFEAARARHLDLTRADQVEGLPEDKVRGSAIQWGADPNGYRAKSVHFLNTEPTERRQQHEQDTTGARLRRFLYAARERVEVGAGV